MGLHQGGKGERSEKRGERGRERGKIGRQSEWDTEREGGEREVGGIWGGIYRRDGGEIWRDSGKTGREGETVGREGGRERLGIQRKKGVKTERGGKDRQREEEDREEGGR